MSVLSINGWIVVQNKVTGGSVDFAQDWAAYRDGFGSASLDDNYWIGNEFIHQMTSTGNYALRVEVRDSSRTDSPRRNVVATFCLNYILNVAL